MYEIYFWPYLRPFLHFFSDIYAHIVFINGEVSFQDHNDPICWPFTSLNELIDLKEVTDDVSSYFSNLTNGKFLCIVKTAQNFEVYGLYVDHNKSAWYEIMTKWISHFTDTDVNCKALRALFNRRLTRFQEIKKRYNVQGNLKIKETMIRLLHYQDRKCRQCRLIQQPHIQVLTHMIFMKSLAIFLLRKTVIDKLCMIIF
jgi:hypothetical protein